MVEMMVMPFTKLRLQGTDNLNREGEDLVALPPIKCFSMSPQCGRGYSYTRTRIKVSHVVSEQMQYIKDLVHKRKHMHCV